MKIHSAEIATFISFTLTLFLASGCISFPPRLRQQSPVYERHFKPAHGVTYSYGRFTNLFGKNNELHVLRIDLSEASVKFAIHENAGTSVPLRRTSDVAASYNALAAVNGGFFRWNELYPFYLHKVNGKNWHPDCKGYKGFAFNNDTRDFYVGELRADKIAKYDNIICGDWILDSHHLDEGACRAGGEAPRTLLGMTEENELLLIVVDGRDSGRSEGLNYQESAALMNMFGCTRGFALDGGGSSTMVIRKDAIPTSFGVGSYDCTNAPSISVMNNPSDTDKMTGVRRERAVLDHLLILDERSRTPDVEMVDDPDRNKK